MCLGTVGLVLAVEADKTVEVHAGGRDISASLLAFSGTLAPGDWVLVHSGIVLARLTEQEAREALELRNPTPEGAR